MSESILSNSNHVFKNRNYSVFTGPGYEDLGQRLQDMQSDRFTYYSTKYDKFPDGTDNITLSGFSPVNKIAGTHILFLASLISNDITLSQFSVLIVLLQSFIKSLTIVLPFYPVGTNERVDVEGRVATANTYAMLLSSLPSCGKPARLMIYDIHALQERFYFHGSIIPSLHSALPLLIPRLEARNITAVAFPDDGAAKRFGHFFRRLGYHIIVCGKVRQGTKRIVTIQDGEPLGRKIVIIDDLAQTGGTLYEAGVQLKRHGATEVYAYVTHGVFPGESWKRFLYSESINDINLHSTTPHLSPAIKSRTYTHSPPPYYNTPPPPSSQGSSSSFNVPHETIPIFSLPPPSILNNEPRPLSTSSIDMSNDQQYNTPLQPNDSNSQSCNSKKMKPNVLFEKFWITNSIPHTIDRVPLDDVFEVIDLLPQIVSDLEFRAE